MIRYVTIHGGVQGVGYRVWTELTALRHGLEGWVRNRRDGTVEAVFAGDAETIVDMVAACRRGPAGARVTKLEEREASPAELAARRPGEHFSVLPTL